MTKLTLSYILLIYIISTFFLIQSSLASNKITLGNKIVKDYSNFYSKKRLIKMGLVFSAMGLIANTNIDKNFQDWHNNNIKSSKSDKKSKVFKNFGEKNYLIPISLLASGAYWLNNRSNVGNWGLNSVRSYIVGAPIVWVMQYVTGGSRPNDKNPTSKWRPFNDNNGVSGHAFVGAVPFLVLAKMNDNKFIKYSAYLASTLTAWSRVNDDSHYLSQAILGWYIAHEAVSSVF